MVDAKELPPASSTTVSQLQLGHPELGCDSRRHYLISLLRDLFLPEPQRLSEFCAGGSPLRSACPVPRHSTAPASSMTATPPLSFVC